MLAVARVLTMVLSLKLDFCRYNDMFAFVILIINTKIVAKALSISRPVAIFKKK